MNIWDAMDLNWFGWILMRDLERISMICLIEGWEREGNEQSENKSVRNSSNTSYRYFYTNNLEYDLTL